MIHAYADYTLSKLRYSDEEEAKYATKESRNTPEYRDYEDRMHQKLVDKMAEVQGKVKHLKFFKSFEWVLFIIPTLASAYSNFYSIETIGYMNVIRFVLTALISYLAVQLYDTDLSATLLPEKCMMPFTALAVAYNLTINIGSFVSSIFIYSIIFAMLKFVQTYAPYAATLTGSGRAVQSSSVFAGGDVRYMSAAFVMFIGQPYTLLGFGLGMMVSTILFILIEKVDKNSFVSAGMFMSCGVVVGIVVRCLVYHL